MRRQNVRRKIAYRICSALLILGMAFQGISMDAMAADGNGKTREEAGEQGGSETKERLIIDSQEDFLEFAQKCWDADYSVGLEVSLEEDIDLGQLPEGTEFKGITSFSGLFLGNYHTISGLHLTGTGETTGLFWYLEQGARVRDLRVKGTIDCSESKVCAGGIAGINAGSIQGCFFKGTICSLGVTGGIVGKNGGSGSIVRCTTSGAVDGVHKVGGVVGENRGVITDCSNAATVNADTRWIDMEGEEELTLSATGIWSGIQDKIEDGTDFGGITGWSNGIIAGCSNKAVVGYQHAGKNVGGIVGRQDGQVIRCVNSGRIYGKQNVGGIVGLTEPSLVREDVEELGAKVTELHDLMDRMIDDMEKMGDDLHGDFRSINGKARESADTADALLTEMRQVVEKNVDVINELARRIDYCMNHFGTALDYLNQAIGKGDGLINDLDQLKKDLDITEKMEQEDYEPAKQKRLVLESGIGGKLTTDSVEPASESRVTISVIAEKGYRLAKLTKRCYGKEEEDVTAQVENGKYVMAQMPAENVKMDALFAYVGAYALESNAGGKALLAEDGRTLRIQPLAGYRVLSVTVDGGENLYAGEDLVLPDFAETGWPHKVMIQFAKESEEPEAPLADGSLAVKAISGVGGVILADHATVLPGETVRILAQNDSGYCLSSLQIQGGENLADQVKEGTYDYEVPAEMTGTIEITASYRPVECILESATVGGSGSYVVVDQNVMVTVVSDAGFHVQAMQLKNELGEDIPFERKYEDSDVYQFPLGLLDGHMARATVIFERQNNHEAVREAKENMENQTDHIVEGVNNISSVSDQIRAILVDDLGNGKKPEDLSEAEIKELRDLLIDLSGYVSETGVHAGSILGDLNTIVRISGPYAEEAVEQAGNTLELISKDAHAMSNALQSAGKELQGIVDYLNALDELRAVNFSSDFDRNSEELKAELDQMADLLDRLDQHTYLHSEKLEQDMRAVNDKMNEVLNLLVNRMDDMQSMANGEDVIEDFSDREEDAADYAKVSGCTNKGVINGDRNVGGVAGAMGLEKTGTAQEKRISVGNRYQARARMQDCENLGYITVKTENGGCIVGSLELGYVTQCLADGRVQGEAANYLGGIAGQSTGTIVSCNSLAVLCGGDYIGGIAGQATAVRDCYSMVTILDAKEWVGAIVGRQAYDGDEEDVTVLRHLTKEKMSGNYYCSSKLYGVNGVSSSGVAQAVTYQELLALPHASDVFSELTVSFIDADQNLIKKIILPYGTDLSTLQYPDIKTARGEYMEWYGLPGTVMEGNLVLQASEMTNVTILSGVQEGKNKPVALAEGTFTEEASIHIEDYAGSVPEEAPVGSICHFYHVTLENTTLGDAAVTRVRLLREEDGVAHVFRLDDGKWTKLNTKTLGSYEEVQMHGTEAVFCVAVLKKEINWGMIILIVLLVLVIFILLVVIFKLIKRQKKLKQRRELFWEEKENDTEEP